MLIGLGAGAGFPLGLAVIAWRTPDAAASAATSGVALGAGYTVAALGPLLIGALLDLTGAYPVALTVLLVAATVQGFAIVRIGDPPPSEPGVAAEMAPGTAARRRLPTRS